ncbi:general negative regulator of transcription subunit 5 [Mortierella hygrophila]|uniref:General negative regulator of transcription subunit n=1 Tax=Mortierella hygrophila TaxID=979708 RepID=A0A9P6F3H3_9FUNG|nr:general negative regulator of transcription subunit 5 [Mortierella hygrophila]
MATRKLQTEIDKVLKKVAEGVETFEETLEKIETSTNVNQKEKYESDLKKEIKKLQRLRDQIKTWISSNDIKDKRALMDNRKLIEQQMERFKAIEKEMKTKAYSREGLIMSGRMDPKEKEKAETCSWVTERVEALAIQIEALEAEVETLQAGAKKGKNNPAKERISDLEDKIERHKWHQGRLELILRLLENGQIETDKVLGIQEDVNYYVDENLDPDFAEDEEIYTDLNLEEEEDYFTVGTDDHLHDHDDDKHSESHEPVPSKKNVKEQHEPEPSPTKATAKPIPTKKASMSETKETKPVPTASPATAKATPVNVPPSRQPTQPRTGVVESPIIQYATAVAANLPAETPRTAPSASPSVAAATLKKDSPQAANVTAKVETTSPQPAAATAPVPASSVPTATISASPTPAVAEVSSQGAKTGSPAVAPAPKSSTATSKEPSTSVSTTESSATMAGSSLAPVLATTEDNQKDAASGQQASTSTAQALSAGEPEIRLPAALADLAHSFEVSKERAMTKEVGFFVHQMLEASYQFIPEAGDTERPKAPKNPYPTPSYYPQTPPPGLFENPATFEKFDIDTLFFIFYYQQGTYQQFLAARELKKQSWRFHKKYLTWFQRHEEPKAITDDYEQGTYIYFDYEGAWCQRKKTDFRFEYKFLEDSDLV